MNKPPQSHGISPDAPEYVETWARDLIAAAGKREARKLLADYEALAGDTKVTKHGQKQAAARAKALRKLL
jgi:hypothetical protein